ncbi:MAG: hypothetical protein ACT4P1_10675 [Sporichthyaceae bacterium]
MFATAMTLDRQSLLDQVESVSRMLAALDRIEVEGWDGPTGDVLLAYARREVVRPAVRSAGLAGSAAESAEATGWSVAWEALSNPAIRTASSPWGFVTTAVRRAVLGDQMAERYRTAASTAWRIERFRAASAAGDGRRHGEWRAVADRGALTRPLSLTALVEDGYDRPFTDHLPCEAESGVDVLVEVLVRGGWSPQIAREVVLHVADHAPNNRPDRSEVPGWRGLAIGLGIAPWQARRVTVLLLGAPGWPGLVERLATGGVAALHGPAIDAAVRATRDESKRTPARTAQRVECRLSGRTAVAS